MGAENRFAVRITRPEGIPASGAGTLAVMIAPFADRNTAELEAGLAAGSVIVGSALPYAEAVELQGVFQGLGADAEVLEAVSDGWRVAEAVRAAPPTTETTLPFGKRRHRGLDAPGVPPAIQGTQPLDLSMLRAALDPARRAPLPTTPRSAPASASTHRSAAVPGIAATQPFDAGALRRRLNTASALAKTQQLDTNALRAQLTPFTADQRDHVTRAGMPATQALSREALLAPPRFTVAPPVPSEAPGVLPPRITPTPEPRLSRSTQGQAPVYATPFEETMPVPGIIPEPADTRHTAGLLPAVAPRHGGIEETIPVHGLPAVALDSLEKIGQRPPLIAQTGSMGSVNDGPLVFQLEVPRASITQTGSVPMPVELTFDDDEPPAAEGGDGSVRYRLEDGPVDGRIDRSRIGGRIIMIPTPATELDMPVLDLGSAAESRSPAPEPTTEHMPLFGATTPSPGPPVVVRAPAPPIPRLIQPGMPSSAMRPGAGHSPSTAAMLSVVLPGMGQIYNGQRERAIWFALGWVLIIPWVWSVLDAWSIGTRIQRGAFAPPDPRRQRGAVGSQLVLNLSILFGVGVGAFLWTRINRQPQVERPIERPAPPVAAAAATTEDASVEDAAPSRDLGLSDADRQKVDGWLREGRLKCGKGLFAECEEIMHAVLAEDPDNGEAYSLLVEAIAKRKAQSRPDGGLPSPADPPTD